MYWYRPHLREDYTQELRALRADHRRPERGGYWSPTNRELTLTLDDLLLEGDDIAPWARMKLAGGDNGRVELEHRTPERTYPLATVSVEMSNPRAWMVHCHIAEHLEGGMFTYHVQ